MDQLNFDAESITEMKSFYQEELAKTLRRLEHINGVLSQLGAKGAQVDISFTDSKRAISKPKTSTAKRKYKKKRGPKSKWDKAIIKTIVSAGRPLSYDEITNFLMISEGRDSSKRKNTKATVQNTVFRLRHDKKLNTFSMGTRTKYIAPKTWFESNGEIKEEFKSKVVVPKKAKKPGPKTPKRGPGRPRKKTIKAKVKASVKPANDTKKVITKKPVKKAAGKVKTTAKAKASAPKKASKPTAKKVVVKKTPAKKVAAKKSTAKKVAAKKAPVKKVATKKAATQAKPRVRKSATAKKPIAAPKKKVAAKKPTAKKAAPKKSTPKKSAKKKVDPKTPRKIAMTKTVKTKRKK